MVSYFVDLPESLIFKALAGIKVLLSLTDISCLVVKNDRARVVELEDLRQRCVPCTLIWFKVAVFDTNKCILGIINTFPSILP